MKEEPYLTTDEAAAYLKVCRKTVYRLARAGRLPAVRVGRHWRFRRRDLQAWFSTRSGVSEP